MYVNPLRYTANNTEVTINSNEPNGSTIIDDSTEIKIYNVADDQYLPDSNRIYDYSQYEDVTNDYPITVNSDNTVSINFGDINTPYIIKVISKYQSDSEGNVNIQQWASMVTTNKYYGTDDTAKYGNNITFAISNGNGNGDDTDSDAGADSEKENNELPDTGSDEKNGVILGSLFAAIGALLLGKNHRKINDKK
ncbi:fibrinogen-binding adhesin SdrG C-terminal domain-containing protein [Staphylococcus haemolyticus]|nr:fibrinogen-binding adhesin SdrG C-terminal domain-containing protein [Staphylococcus haemolyticus]